MNKTITIKNIRTLDEWKEIFKNKSKDELLEMSYGMAQQLEMIEKILKGEEE